jgi:hypothetical protein
VIQVFVSFQRRSRRFKFSTDRDCLPPDIDCFTEREVEDLEVLKEACKVLEAWGFVVCIDLGGYFYETAKEGYG